MVEKFISYNVVCSSDFRQKVLDLADVKHLSPGDFVRAVFLLVDPAVVAGYPDPGEPGDDDREIILVRSGAGQGRVVKRKPRLQLRLPKGIAGADIRKALALYLDIDRGDLKLSLNKPQKIEQAVTVPGRLEDLIQDLCFTPLQGGVQSREDAFYVLGLPYHAIPDEKTIKTRYRQLARICHPDHPMGSHDKMTQLNEAVTLLKKQVG